MDDIRKNSAVAGDKSDDSEKVPTYDVSDGDSGIVVVSDLKRNLSGRHIQMITIGGSIGTALFVSIGTGLVNGGPGRAPKFWSNRDSEAFLIPWEISALNLVLTFWRDDIPVEAVCAACIVLYAIINLFAVKWYGESEFWLSSGKLLLIGLLFCFTFITMVGGNPKHDAYGFRYWRTPGAFAEYVTTGSLGKFEGFLAALWQAAFTIVGPEYIAMMAGEAAHPRQTLKRAFKTVYIRFGIFFIGGALACGIVIPYNDPNLIAVLNGTGSGTAAASPYVIAMQNLGIGFLPHLTNALLVTSIFSAGNSFCASRTLYSLSLDGHAPKFLRKCTKNGVPIWCFCITMIFPFLSFLTIGSGSAQVITWQVLLYVERNFLLILSRLANLTEASQMIDYICMCTIYIFFYRAMKAQGYDRKDLPYIGWAQPYCAWFGLVTMIFTVTCYGYTVLLPGWWDIGTFFSYYTMVFACPVLYVGWKVIKRTKIIKPAEADLVWERPAIDEYEANVLEPFVGFWQEVKVMVGLGKKAEHVE
ncbi:General amino acid permease [Lachnellula willkommii]|uniref:General amino acid permease n=1 Tax=Lachnellula willkommii TaxID=215461 RepID=A0A559M908_9HELO|nr:General amino acid permease [Lachnellula willkommii]